MIPVNNDSDGCSAISSNCVIWQGPDIECLNLCKGDSVSSVVFKLATEVCEILDILDIDGYDLSCLNIVGCAPEDFKALIQFLIGRICELENITSPVNPATGCPDCTVTIASCFYYLNPQGDTITIMSLVDYVTAIGNRLCLMANEIATIQSTLISLNLRITDLENGVNQVKNAVLANDSPMVTPLCVLPNNVPVEQGVLLTALEAKFCELIGATGQASNLYAAILKQCAGLNSAPQLAGSGNMASIPGWVNGVANLSDSFANMWLTVCDIRSAILNIQVNCCPTLCDAISVVVTAALNSPNDLRLYFTGVVPVNFVECNPTGTLITISDTTGGSVTIQVPVITNLNNGLGYTVDLSATPVNTSDDLVITTNFCFNDPATGTQCQSVYTYIVVNQLTCVPLILTPASTSISYSFNWVTGPASFEIQLYDASGTVLISSQTTSLGGAGTINGIFSGLSVGTGYRVRLKVTVGTNTSECVFNSVSTLAPSCLPPSVVAAGIIVSGTPIINLNRACGYGVLAGSTITNTGVTTINGSLGLDPGSSITGAPVVTGATDVNNAAAIAAKIDLTAAYLAAQAATSTGDLSGIDLGGLTLSPGVYTFSSSAAITGTLILDGPGTYIFQIGTTLTTDGASDIILINGATADDVFFAVGSSATLGTSSTFNGIIMALTSITIDGGTVNGALMAQTGAVTFSAGTTVNYIGC